MPENNPLSLRGKMKDYLKKLVRRNECGAEIIECLLCKKNLNGIALYITIDPAHEEPITICEQCHDLRELEGSNEQ